MPELTYQHVLGIILTLLLIVMIGVYSGRLVKTAGDFSHGGRKAKRGIIAGTIMGTLVGGASTIGTAQLAYLYGFSAWWFTLGAGIGCLLLAFFFAEPLYQSGKETLPQILAEEFGQISRPISSVFVSIGTFINIIAQVLSAAALLTSIFRISPIAASIIAVLLMSAYVIFGGVLGVGLVGIAKLILLYISVALGGILAITLGGGLGQFTRTFPSYPYFSLFGRGILVDGAAGFSLILGALSTQTYIQAVLSAESLKEAKAGSLISGLFTPPIGIAAIYIGLYMKMRHPDINPASAFPLFVMENMNPWLAGVVLATLLIAVVGTGAGLSLGISTMFTKDIYIRYFDKNADDVKQLHVSRYVILLTLFVALLFTVGNAKSLILKWSFMSMGLRGATVFLPLCAALFLKGRVNSKYAVASMVISPLSMMLGKLMLPQNIDPLLLGIFISLLLVGRGMWLGKGNIT